VVGAAAGGAQGDDGGGDTVNVRMFRACQCFFSTFCAKEKIFLEKRTD